MKIKIESGVKIVSVRRGRKRKYPFSLMKRGDSFVVRPNTEKMLWSVRNAASIYSRDHKIRLSVLKTEDNTYRCWRVK